MSAAIVAEGLTKRFFQMPTWRRVMRDAFCRSPKCALPAVDGVSLEIQEGELFGLLGSNGAGKTTLIKILCTLILPDSGRATVNGFDLADEIRVKASIGWVSGEERSFYWRLTGRQNLEFFAALHGLSPREAKERITRGAKWLEMDEFLDRRFDRYSSGMKQRLGIVRGLLNDPKILFLDEPTRSLDPMSAAHLRTVVRRLAYQQGHTVVLVTHQLHEAEDLCDRLAILHRGRVRVVADPVTLRRRVEGRSYRFRVYGPEKTGEPLNRLLPGFRVRPFAGDPRRWMVEFRLPSEGVESLAHAIERMGSAGVQIEEVETPDLGLEEVFQKFSRDADVTDEGLS